jgi:hypothetical protein
MKQNYSIFVSIALVAATMFFCGKKIDFLLYTLLGRSILVLSIIGLTLFDKYAGILATIIITTLYNINDYKEGLTNANGCEVENPKPSTSTNVLYGAESFSSPAAFSPHNNSQNDNMTELATQGQGPPNLSNTLV